MKRPAILAALLTLGGCPAPPAVAPERVAATERVRESCFWVDDDRLTDILESVERDRLAGVPRDEIRASIARWCKDDLCNECADEIMAQVFGTNE